MVSSSDPILKIDDISLGNILISSLFLKNNKNFTSLIYDRAFEIGFDAIGVSGTNTSQETSENLEKFILKKFHGDMTWMEDTLYRRKKIKNLFCRILHWRITF